MEKQDLICGVEKKLVEDFLLLLKNRYRALDEATYLLESETGMSNIINIMNVRDIISHLVTMLECSSKEERKQQIILAEEHLRRAIGETYEVSLNTIGSKTNEIYKYYKRYILPIQNRYSILKEFPDDIKIRSELEEIKALRLEGRRRKASNIWDDKFEEGIKAFVEAFEKLNSLKTKLENACETYYKLKNDLFLKKTLYLSIILAIISLIIAILFLLK
ncbi:MAG: hypothetical protein PHE49_06770 [bacterium]|nr:hypothetical protein [bacterium]